MSNNDSHVTIHMAASLDGFIARKDGSVDWMETLETSDEFAGGDTMDPGFVEAFLKAIDCYVMGSQTVCQKRGISHEAASHDSRLRARQHRWAGVFVPEGLNDGSLA
jgi:hypothetical protein